MVTLSYDENFRRLLSVFVNFANAPGQCFFDVFLLALVYVSPEDCGDLSFFVFPGFVACVWIFCQHLLGNPVKEEVGKRGLSAGPHFFALSAIFVDPKSIQSNHLLTV
jgi:hypothetical protein